MDVAVLTNQILSAWWPSNRPTESSYATAKYAIYTIFPLKKSPAPLLFVSLSWYWHLLFRVSLSMHICIMSVNSSTFVSNITNTLSSSNITRDGKAHRFSTQYNSSNIGRVQKCLLYIFFHMTKLHNDGVHPAIETFVIPLNTIRINSLNMQRIKSFKKISP